MALDWILIEQLEVHSIVGVHAWEQRKPRPILLDLELGADLRQAAASDQLRDAINYRAVADEVIRLAQAREYHLIETLAETLARRLFERFPILGLRLAVYKPGAVQQARTVAVRIERRREDYALCGR